MSFGGLANCPVCWDSPDICQCTKEEIRRHYENLEKSKTKQKIADKKIVHILLDMAFEQEDEVNGESWEWNFLKSIIKKLNRGKWISLKKAADDYFKINNVDWSDGKTSLSPDFGKKWIERD